MVPVIMCWGFAADGRGLNEGQLGGATEGKCSDSDAPSGPGPWRIKITWRQIPDEISSHSDCGSLTEIHASLTGFHAVFSLISLIKMAAANVDDSEWEELNRTNWKGLGLTDPIKNVEVRAVDASDILHMIQLLSRTNGCCYPLSSKLRVS